jgi:hypothetical protein
MSSSYGPCLSKEEYIQKLAELQEQNATLMASGETPESIAERNTAQELELHIDFRLGVNFPEEKRVYMRRLHHDIQLRKEELVTRLSTGKLTRESFVTAMQKLTKSMAKEYAKILNTEELQMFLDIEPNTLPVLPFDDPEKIGT